MKAAAKASRESPRRRGKKGGGRVSPKQNKLAARWAAAASENNMTGQTLWEAASQGDLAKVNACIAARVDVDWIDSYDGTTAAWIAAKDNNTQILQVGRLRSDYDLVFNQLYVVTGVRLRGVDTTHKHLCLLRHSRALALICSTRQLARTSGRLRRWQHTTAA